jgi:hypothetical protein
MQEQRARVRSSDSAERFAAALLIPGVLAERLRELNDVQLGQVLEHEVCSNMSVLAPELTVCMEAAERLRRSVRTGKRIARRRSWTAMRDEGVHIMHAESALYRGRIPHLLLPFQMNRFASNVFMVSNIAEARACLLEARFRETSRCPPVLIHRTRQTIQLYEDKQRSSHF